MCRGVFANAGSSFTQSMNWLGSLLFGFARRKASMLLYGPPQRFGYCQIAERPRGIRIGFRTPTLEFSPVAVC